MKTIKILKKSADFIGMLLITVSRFIAKQWIWVVPAVITTVAIVIYGIYLPQTMFVHIAFWLGLLPWLFCLMFFEASTTFKGSLRLTASIFMLAVAVMGIFPMSVMWYSLPWTILVLIWTVVTISQTKDGAWLIILALLLLILGFFRERSDDKKDTYVASHPAETVILKYVEKKSITEVYAFIEDKGIYRMTVPEAWRFKNGDTVKIVIYKDCIVVCDK